jgi:hypothetical protein
MRSFVLPFHAFFAFILSLSVPFRLCKDCDQTLTRKRELFEKTKKKGAFELYFALKKRPLLQTPNSSFLSNASD